ncbi:MAG: helix-turn-helix domain-containing protein [Lachnospiraceae bacterium]
MKIREIRRRKNITQKQLANAIGVSPTVVSKYEKGIVIPPANRLEKIADFLNVSVDKLLDKQEPWIIEAPIKQKNGIPSVDMDKYDTNDFQVARTILDESNGICELCGEQAPFYTRDGTPYLEAHFVQWLSDGGRATIDNVVALCPNCHKKIHILHLKEDIEYLRKEAAKHKEPTMDYMYDINGEKF